MNHLEPASSSTPPADPDSWTNEQWIEWLTATDVDAPIASGQPATVAGRVVHSTGGQLLGQTMTGLAQAIYGRQIEKPAIVVEAGSEPGNDQPFALHLDHEHPERSFVILPAKSPD